MESVTTRAAEIRERIADACGRAGRNPAQVVLVGVTKRRTDAEASELLAAGVHNLGENYVQNALARVEAVGRDRARWHMIGHLQRNKARHMVAFADVLHTIDSEAIANEVGRRAVAIGREIECLVEVNVAGETSKHGLSPADLERVYEHCCGVDGISVNGLMGMAPFTDDPEEARPVFAELREMCGKLVNCGLPAEHLSMGMSGDFEVAIEEGSTIVRIGTALFGPRPS